MLTSPPPIGSEIARVTEARPIHTALAQIGEIKFVITSNYDALLETALHKYQRMLTKHVYDLQNPKTGHFAGNPFIRPPAIVLHKMHGTVEQPRSMVITQSDYIRYLANLNDPDRGMPEFFRKTIIPNSNLLFLGYGLDDWNFQVIWEGALSHHRDAGAQLDSYAVQKLPADPNRAGFLRTFWAKRSITLIDYDLTEFAVELARAFSLDLPQLGIVKGRPSTTTPAGNIQSQPEAPSPGQTSAPGPAAAEGHPLPSDGPSPAEAATAREGGRGAGGEGCPKESGQI